MAAVRRTSLTNPTYRLSAADRATLGLMASMGLWSQTALAAEFGVSRKTVSDCERRRSR